MWAQSEASSILTSVTPQRFSHLMTLEEPQDNGKKRH